MRKVSRWCGASRLSINRIGLAAVLFIIVSGAVSLYIAGLMRGFAFSSNFVELLLRKDRHPARDVRCADEVVARRAETRIHLIRRRRVARRGGLMSFNLAVMGLGATALLLGLWLLGS